MKSLLVVLFLLIPQIVIAKTVTVAWDPPAYVKGASCDEIGRLLTTDEIEDLVYSLEWRYEGEEEWNCIETVNSVYSFDLPNGYYEMRVGAYRSSADEPDCYTDIVQFFVGSPIYPPGNIGNLRATDIP